GGTMQALQVVLFVVVAALALALLGYLLRSRPTRARGWQPGGVRPDAPGPAREPGAPASPGAPSPAAAGAAASSTGAAAGAQAGGAAAPSGAAAGVAAAEPPARGAGPPPGL